MTNEPVLPKPQKTLQELEAENACLRTQLHETEEVLQAIRSGEVDAVVVGTREKDTVYTFFGADHPYRIMVESMAEGAVTLDDNGTVLYSNPSFIRLIDWPEASVFGSSILTYVVPRDIPTLLSLLDSDTGGKAEITLQSRGGLQIPVYVSTSKVDLIGSIGISLVITDLSEQKKHDEIVASERLARSILEHAAEAIVVCNADGRITHANHQAALLCADNPLRKPFSSAFHIDFPQTVISDATPAEVHTVAQLEDVARGKIVASGWEAVLQVGSEKERFVHLSSGPLLNERQDISGAVIILADITQTRLAAEALLVSERQLRLLNRTLEDRVEERTLQLSRANFELTLKNRELQDFANAASHDLQEPLRKIGTFASLLRMDAADRMGEDALNYLTRIEKATVRMSRLINDLLSFSRIVTRAQPFGWVDMNHVVRDVLEDAEIRLKETGAQIEQGDLPGLNADATQMHQLMQNLISNALLYQAEGNQPRIRIWSELSSDRSEPVCRIFVEDNGIGFDERYLDRIFSPFQRLHGKSQYPGTGMGLAICHRIVERHKGQITAESQPGKGSRFIVRLPVYQPSPEPAPGV